MFLYKLQQYEQYRLEKKETRVQLKLQSESQNKTASNAISRLIKIINRLIMLITVNYWDVIIFLFVSLIDSWDVISWLILH